jgi:FkbM family methyltransferase
VQTTNGAAADVYRMRWGFQMRLDVNDPLQRGLADRGLYEPEVSWIYPYLLSPGDVVVDGGAHVGYLSLLAARCVGALGRVHAFEPVRATNAALAANVALNGLRNVTVNRLALADRPGTMDLEVPIDPNGTALLAWGASVVRLGRGASETVDMVTLDEYAASRGIDRLRLVKLDLEGGERRAIEGMRDLLRSGRVSYLVCELNKFLADAAGERYDAVREALDGYGYRCYALTKDWSLRPQTAPIRELDVAVVDLLFARSAA